jgi:hypothetical protein
MHKRGQREKGVNSLGDVTTGVQIFFANLWPVSKYYAPETLNTSISILRTPKIIGAPLPPNKPKIFSTTNWCPARVHPRVKLRLLTRKLIGNFRPVNLKFF